jgi:hypothetical protein
MVKFQFLDDSGNGQAAREVAAERGRKAGSESDTNGLTQWEAYRQIMADDLHICDLK